MSKRSIRNCGESLLDDFPLRQITPRLCASISRVGSKDGGIREHSELSYGPLTATHVLQAKNATLYYPNRTKFKQVDVEPQRHIQNKMDVRLLGLTVTDVDERGRAGQGNSIQVTTRNQGSQ